MRGSRWIVAALLLALGAVSSSAQPGSTGLAAAHGAVPAAARTGSGVDITARLLVDRLAQRWGQPVVVENRPGGDGIVAICGFVSAKDDHILLFSPSLGVHRASLLHDNLPYRPEDLGADRAGDPTPSSRCRCRSTCRSNSLKELVELIRAQPGKINWAGVTGALDFVFEGFLKTANLEMSKVPYRNAVDAANDLAAGAHPGLPLGATRSSGRRLQAGKVKVLAMSNSVRAPAAPDMSRPSPRPAIPASPRRAGRPVRPAQHADGAARAHRRRHQGGAWTPIRPIGERLTLTGQFVNPGGPADFGKSIDEQRAQSPAPPSCSASSRSSSAQAAPPTRSLRRRPSAWSATR